MLRMLYEASLRLIAFSSDRIQYTDTNSTNMDGYPEMQPIIECYMPEDERRIDPKYTTVIGTFLGGAIGVVVLLVVNLVSAKMGICAGATDGSALGSFAVMIGVQLVAMMTHTVLMPQYSKLSLPRL